MNKFTKSLTLAGLVLGLFVGTAFAIGPIVTISDLPEYTTSDNFQLSYSALANDASSITAKFYVRKEGESYAQFGSVLNGASGIIGVTSTQINEQKKFYFKVEITSSNGSAIDETSVFFDISGPSPVQNYWKERISPEIYKLHWKNPGDSDFSRVFIYRGDEAGFSADGSHKIAEVGGAADDEVTWENIGLTSGNEYYYALRAVDNAGNSSSLVGDGGTIVEETIKVEGGATEEEVVLLPSGKEVGQVLGEEEEEGAMEEVILGESETAFDEAVNTLTRTTKGKIAAISAFVIGLILFFFTNKRKQ